MFAPKLKLSKLAFCLIFMIQCNLRANQTELDDVRMQLWLSGLSVVNANYTWQDAVDFVNQNPDAARGWATDIAPRAHCSLVYKAPWGRIWTLGALYNLNLLFLRDVIIPLFNKNDYVLVPFWGRLLPEIGDYYRTLFRNAKFPENFYFLGNSDACTDILRAEGLRTFTVSPNAFIDPNTFFPIALQRNYDAVYLGDVRPDKRLELASSVLQNLLVVTQANEENRKVVASAKNIVVSPPITQYPFYVNQAHCGLILSDAEGGCYASTEYLYCGVPVVSTHCSGGREAYYDEVTAVLVDPTAEAVQKGVELIKERAPDPWEVRRRALAVSDKMLNTLAYEVLRPILAKHRDAYAANPRELVDAAIRKSKRKESKGRTVFQPENPTHPSVEKIRKEQREH